MLWRQLLKRLLALDCASCEGFSKSGNTVFTSQEHAARTEVACDLLDGINRLAMGTMVLQPSSSFAEHGLHSPSTTMGSRRQLKKQKADSLGDEGGFESLLWVQGFAYFLPFQTEKRKA